MTDEIKFRYSETVDEGFRPWFGNHPGPPHDFEWGGPVRLRDGTETYDRGARYTDWISTGRPNDIVGYKRKAALPPVTGRFPIDWDVEPAPASPIAAIVGALSGAAVMALMVWAWIS